MERYAASLVIGEAQIRTTVRHRLAPVKTAISKTTGENVLGRTWARKPVQPLWETVRRLLGN